MVILRELAKGIRKRGIERREGGSNFNKNFDNKLARTVFFSFNVTFYGLIDWIKDTFVYVFSVMETWKPFPQRL